MADLIDRQAAMDNLKKSLAFSENELDIGEFRRGCIAAIRDDIGNIKHLPAVDAVEVGSCEGCVYSHRKRPQKCSCCRRNRDLKDCYTRREENAAD